MSARVPVVLSIAGSDCSGGAGIQADIKASNASGVYCATVITSITAQNPQEVKDVKYVGDDILKLQLDSVLESVRPDAVKIGLIPSVQAAVIIRDYILKYKLTNIVLDPVFKATSGAALYEEPSEYANKIGTILFEYVTLVTPNLMELEELSQIPSENISVQAKCIIEKFNVANLLVKGGHSIEPVCKDVLYKKDLTFCQYSSSRINSPHTHGTGCTLSSAIASGLAKGLTLETSIEYAKHLVTKAIEYGQIYQPFSDNGPVCPSPLSLKSAPLKMF